MSEIKMCPVGCGPLRADGFCEEGGSAFYTDIRLLKRGTEIVEKRILQHCSPDDYPSVEIGKKFYSEASPNTKSL
jgi:hypothetical protein